MLQFKTQYFTINNLKLTKSKTFSSCTTDVEVAIITNEMKKKNSILFILKCAFLSIIGKHSRLMLPNGAERRSKTHRINPQEILFLNTRKT